MKSTKKAILIAWIALFLFFLPASMSSATDKTFEAAIERGLEFLEKVQNSDGGWGYTPGGMSYVEPTGLALFIFANKKNSRHTSAIQSGIEFLESIEHKDGGFGINRIDNELSWMSYAPLLAYTVLGYKNKKERLQRVLLHGNTDPTGKLTKEEIMARQELLQFDVTKKGWCWYGNTASWVDPTALSILSLCYSGVSPEQPRIQEAIAMLFERACKKGGWNTGNPSMFGKAIPPNPVSTSLALLALHSARVNIDQEFFNSTMHYLQAQAQQQDISSFVLGFVIMVFNRYHYQKEWTATQAERLLERQQTDGSFGPLLYDSLFSLCALMSFDTAKAQQ